MSQYRKYILITVIVSALLGPVTIGVKIWDSPDLSEIASCGTVPIFSVPNFSSLLAVPPAQERGVIAQMSSAMAMLRGIKKAPESGWKNFWDEFIDDNAEDIGYERFGSVRFGISDIWTPFITSPKNAPLIKEGNNLIEKDLANPDTGYRVTAATLNRLNEIIANLDFPGELILYIRDSVKALKGRIIVRSAASWEDTPERNQAGQLISEEAGDASSVDFAVRTILDHALRRMWVDENMAKRRTPGVPNLITSGGGVGFLVQPFIDFDASGTAMTDVYGRTSIMAVIGASKAAVNGKRANTAQFLFDDSSPDTDPAFNASYINLPHRIYLGREEFCVEDNNGPGMESVIGRYPKINGKVSPISIETAKQLREKLLRLGRKAGRSMDFEWGIKGGRIYPVQMRPVVTGGFNKKPVLIDPGLATKKEIAATPFAIGNTAPEGFTGRVVLFSETLSVADMERFEKEYGRKYIMGKPDAASAVKDMQETLAKVIFDPEQGTWQAHNVNLIDDRIGLGEFTYCNGPVIKDGLMDNLRFRAHPSIRGIWISEEQVTYFSDGILSGRFFLSDAKDGLDPFAAEPSADVSEMQGIVDALSLNWQGRDRSNSRWEINPDWTSKLESAILCITMCREYVSYPDSGSALQVIQKLERLELEQLEKEEGCTIKVADVMRSFENFRAALEFPLFPADWDSVYFRLLREESGLPLEYKKYLAEKSRKSSIPSGDKFHAVVLDIHGEQGAFVEKYRSRDDCELVYILAGYLMGDEIPKLHDELEKIGHKPDFVSIHMGGSDRAGVIFDIIDTIKGNNPNAVISLETSFETGLMKTKCRTNGIILNGRIVGRDLDVKTRYAIADEAYERWKLSRKTNDGIASILYVEDDQSKRTLFINVLTRKLGLNLTDDGANRLADGGCEVYVADSYEKATEIIDSKKIDYIIADGKLPDDKDGGQVIRYAHEHYSKWGVTFLGGDILSASPGFAQKIVMDNPGLPIGTFPSLEYKEMIRRFSEILNMIKQSRLQRAGPAAVKPAPSANSPAKTIFIFGRQSGQLAAFIEKRFGSSFRVVSGDAGEKLSDLNEKIGSDTPDIVISDVTSGEADISVNTVAAVKAKNSRAEFIFIRYGGAEDVTEAMNPGSVILTVNGPFHFHRIEDILKGENHDAVLENEIRFETTLSAKLIRDIRPARAIEGPAVIRMWDGYAAPEYRRSALAGIRVGTERGPYRICFESDLDELVKNACEDGKRNDKNVVTVLPLGRLSSKQTKELSDNHAQVLGVNIAGDEEMGRDDIVMLNGVVFAAIAYLNEDDSAFAQLYRILTGDEGADVATIARLRENPSLIDIVLIPATIHSSARLRDLYELMEREILKAA